MFGALLGLLITLAVLGAIFLAFTLFAIAIPVVVMVAFGLAFLVLPVMILLRILRWGIR